MLNANGEWTVGHGRYWYEGSISIAQECNTIRPGCVVALSNGAIVWDIGTNQLRANGNGVWAFIGTDGVYRDSFGRTATNAYPAHVGPDGAIAYRPHSNQFCTVWEPNGDLWRLSENQPDNIRLLGNRQAIWTEGKTLCCTSGVDLQTPGGEWGWPNAIEVEGRWRLLYQSYSGGALVLDGRIIARGASFYDPDVKEIQPGLLRVQWYYDEAQRQPDYRDVRVSELATLPVLVLPGPAPLPPAPPQPDPGKEPSMAFEQRMPNMVDVVKKVRNEHPEEWAAREDLRFIRRLAWELHQIDSRFGLLGKRMTDVIAADSITFLNPTVDPQLPAEMSCEAADVIGGSHTDSPTPVWNLITKPVRDGGAGAKWIKPERPAGVEVPGPAPQNPPPPAVDAVTHAELNAILDAVQHGMTVALEGLMRDLTGLRVRVEKLEQAPQAQPSQKRTVRTSTAGFGPLKHSHDVEI